MEISLLPRKKRKISSPAIQKKLKFIHITKCGGTTVEHFGKSIGIEWGINDKELQEAACDVQHFWHVPPKYYTRGYLVRILEKYDLFTTVRNPYSRVISEYYCSFGGPAVKSSCVDDFNIWIENKIRSVLKILREGGRVLDHWAPAYFFIVDEDNKLVVDPCNIAHLENIEDELSQLFLKYSMTSANFVSIERKMVGKEKKFGVSDLSVVNIGLIEDLYDLDFKLFGYSNDLEFITSSGNLSKDEMQKELNKKFLSLSSLP